MYLICIVIFYYIYNNRFLLYTFIVYCAEYLQHIKRFILTWHWHYTTIFKIHSQENKMHDCHDNSKVQSGYDVAFLLHRAKGASDTQ